MVRTGVRTDTAHSDTRALRQCTNRHTLLSVCPVELASSEVEHTYTHIYTHAHTHTHTYTHMHTHMHTQL